MSKQDRRDQPELALQTVESSVAPARANRRLAQVEVLRDAGGQPQGYRVRLDNGTTVELPDADAPRRLH